MVEGMVEGKTEVRPSSGLTTGAGIAIAGIWIAAAAVTIISALIAFVWAEPSAEVAKMSEDDQAWAMWILLLLLAAPLIAAFAMTNHILGRSD